jgi:serine/threonine-protein kinase
MGVVYQAIRQVDRSTVALKTVCPNGSISEQDVDRFLREARLLESLKHPNIVAFREMGTSDGTLYFAMDFVDGKDLKRILSESPAPMPIPRAINLIRQLIDALNYAHQKGVVHRDIKPANLLISTVNGRENLSVTDFGLARTYQSSSISGLTVTGQIGGTTPFMAPEQIIQFRDVKPTADQYAVAATLYNLLTKSYVFDFPRTISEQLLMVLQSTPIRIEQRRPDIPAPLAEVIHRGLSRLPEQRFPDLNAFREALSKC